MTDHTLRTTERAAHQDLIGRLTDALRCDVLDGDYDQLKTARLEREAQVDYEVEEIEIMREEEIEIMGVRMSEEEIEIMGVRMSDQRDVIDGDDNLLEFARVTAALSSLSLSVRLIEEIELGPVPPSSRDHVYAALRHVRDAIAGYQRVLAAHASDIRAGVIE
jgi:hypothetical protein